MLFPSNGLENIGNAIELPTQQWHEIETILNSTNAEGNTAYIAGPGGAYHSIIIIYNANDIKFSIYDHNDYNVSWGVKNGSAEQAQNYVNITNKTKPNWGSRVWQIFKTEKVPVLIPYK